MTTRANIEGAVVTSLSAWMAAAGFATTHVGSNANLNSPIARALLDAGYSVVDLDSVADADIAAVTAADLPSIIEFTRIHTLEDIIGNLTGVDTKVGPREERLSQLADRAQKLLDGLVERARRLYGFGTATLTAGVYDLVIAEELET